jgi:Na+-driven multidrug efflux pump
MICLPALRAQVPAILRLAVPITAGLAASTLLGVADALMLAPLGPVPLAAVGLAGAVTMVLRAGAHGVLPVTSGRIGAAFGAGDGRRIPLVLCNALALGALAGLGGAVLMGAIWGAGPVPPLGLAGAGLATLLAETVAPGAAWAVWRTAPSTRRLRLRRPPERTEIRAALRQGLPTGALSAAETLAVGAAVLIIGSFGTVALAANRVAMSVGSVLYMVPQGVEGAVAIRLGQEQGAGDARAVRPVALAALAVATPWLAGSALLLWLAGG